MEVLKIIDNLKDLLIKYSSNSESLLEEELNLIFSKIENINFKDDIDNYAEFVLLGASLFEIKAKRLLPRVDCVVAFVSMGNWDYNVAHVAVGYKSTILPKTFCLK